MGKETFSFTVLSRADIANEHTFLLAVIPSLCARSPGLNSRPSVSKRWLSSLLDRAEAVVLHQTTPDGSSRHGGRVRGRVDAAAILLRAGQKRLHAEVLCAADLALDTALQTQLVTLARESGATSLSISLDQSTVALGENLERLDALARIVFAHRVQLVPYMNELAGRFNAELVDDTDRNLLFELLRHTYPSHAPGPQEAPMDSPWPMRRIETLVNEINAARAAWVQEGHVALKRMRASLAHPHVRDSLAFLVWEDGERVLQSFGDEQKVSLTREQLVNALVYELRKVFRSTGGPACTAWLQGCLTLGQPCQRERPDCDGALVGRLMEKILTRAALEGDEALATLLRERLKAMAHTFWGPERDLRHVNGKYVGRLFNTMKETLS